MAVYVQVILPLNLDKTFTYSVTAEEAECIRPGMRLAVPFGKHKIYTGVALELHGNAPLLYEPKPIHQILDQEPVITKEQLQLWNWMSSYYMCSIGDVFRSAMPSALLLESETLVRKNENPAIEENLSVEEQLILNALEKASSLKVSEILKIKSQKKLFPIIKRLIEKGWVATQEVVQESYKPKFTEYAKLTESFNRLEATSELMQLLKNSPKQRELILHYFQLKAQMRNRVKVSDLLEAAQISKSIYTSLVAKGIFETISILKDRIDFSEKLEEKQFSLSTAQQLAFEEIKEQFIGQDVILFHGVTSSGKTQVYIRLIEQVLAAGQTVLFLLPEIALTAQLVMRLTAQFGNKVAVYHSKYSAHERVEVWNQVLTGSEKAQVVIGARSALFLPFKDLGLVIVDEEHEASYKQQDPAPRYQGRDTAIVLAKQMGARVLLGSATPSLESFFNAKEGKYGYVALKERFGNVRLPEIAMVDLKEAYKRKKMTGHFSQELIESITQALQNREQVILFQNRRGYSPVLECQSCGHVPHCTQCDVSLTYHKVKGQLRCHYCGSGMAFPTRCHSCHSTELTTKGFGTEQIEFELAELFPEARVGRMDQDTTRAKNAIEQLIEDFSSRKIDILVGTQMLAKGLDFENVSLVGIMNADNMLYHPDFRALERSYQMLTQVAGRSGRSDKQGKVLIQTYNPYHNILQQVMYHDYDTMFKEQLYERKIYHYPPYTRLIRITLKHKDFENLKQGALWMANVLRSNLPVFVLGPEEPAVSRIRNEFIRLILIKIPADQSLSGTKKTIQKILDSFESIGQYRSVKVSVNVDFY